MADKAFGVKDINLIGASGTPTIESPNNLNINAVNVAISTDITVAGKVSLGAGTSISSPGSNILTLGTNSVERVRVASDGKIGLGTDAPAIPLDVHGPNINANGLGDVTGQLRIHNSATPFTGSPRAGIVFSTKYRSTPDVPLDGAAIYGGKENITDANKDFFLGFATRDESPNEAVERVRIGSDGKLTIKTTGTVYQNISIEGATYTAQNGSVRIKPATVPGSGTAQFMTFFQSNNGSPGSTVHNVRVEGSLTKGSGSFRIPHPLVGLSTTHDLVHSFIEGPQADNIYRGQVDLVNGTATVNLDTSARMTEGTFVLLNRNISVFTSNETDWTAVRGSVSGNVLTIEAQDNTSTATVSWMVVGERKDPHMFIADWTDDDGRVITEPPKSE